MRMTEYELPVSQPQFERRYSVCDRAMFGNRPSDYDPCSRWGGGSSDEDNGPDDSPCYSNYSQIPYSGSFSMEERDKPVGNSTYCLVASKQMVGIYLTIWVKSDLRDAVRNMKVSCVGRGLMGYLGNKGSISVSMSLHQTSFCFICSHLTSGEKEGDELRRNSDVMEILRKTRFPRVQRRGDENSPQTILEHDRIIWLGDLNYRIALSYRAAKALVEMRNWRALLEKDQANHRPVYSIFIAEVESINGSRIKKTTNGSARIEHFGFRQQIGMLKVLNFGFRSRILNQEMLAKECDMDEDTKFKFFKKRSAFADQTWIKASKLLGMSVHHAFDPEPMPL
ncbi:hypothetical protein M8C21_030671 [Ambrosia artemisiifolia]|uniref:Inositol polyphosphate-related phosphatase domain-containing protein n=1 Tax=Ambrosia artemisiifolia TaxID=4212 RepID=A0AAD5CI12_AMBAR|nr:hypothetical protein M8C21_030671 [Ambrosia artemisiifolia]